MADVPLISDWRACDPETYCAADINRDGLVNVNDLLAVIAGWGGDCP